jgi:hypothetical protein
MFNRVVSFCWTKVISFQTKAREGKQKKEEQKRQKLRKIRKRQRLEYQQYLEDMGNTLAHFSVTEFLPSACHAATPAEP